MRGGGVVIVYASHNIPVVTQYPVGQDEPPSLVSFQVVCPFQKES